MTQPTNPFDATLDEYLHLIARVCPWNLPREGPLLTAFAEWLGGCPDVWADLDALGPEAATRYAEQAGLTQDQYEGLLSALAGLYRWATRDGRAVSNPFTAEFELTRATRRSLFAGAVGPD
jgi:hypothetical protein